MTYTFAPLTPAERATYGGSHPLHIVEVAGHLRRKDKAIRVVSPLTGERYGYDHARAAAAAIERVSDLLPARVSRATAMSVLSQAFVALKHKGSASDIPAELLDACIADADAPAIASLIESARKAKADRKAAKAAADAAAAAKAAAAESSPRNTSAGKPSPQGDTTVKVDTSKTGPTAAEIRAAILSGTFTPEEWQSIAAAVQQVSPV